MVGQRATHLDGIRGIAAFSVFVCHYLQVFLPRVYYTSLVEGHGMGEDKFAISPFNIVVNGNFAVCLFFVLSGYVLSAGFLARGDIEALRRLATKRYLRLALPVLAAVLLAWAILILDGYSYGTVQQVTRSGMKDTYANYVPFWAAVEEGAIGAFFGGEWGLDPVLWTMRTELFGSFLVFALLALFGHDRRRWLAYVAAVAIFYDDYYFAFLLGIVMAEIQNRWSGRDYSLVVVVVLMTIGIYFGSYPYYGAEQGLWSFLPAVGAARKVVFYHIIGAFILILVSCRFSEMRSLLQRPFAGFLGRISYGLYLIHFPLVCSLVTGIWLYLSPHFSYLVTTALGFGASAPLVVAAAYLFTLGVDEPAIRWSERFARLVEGQWPRLASGAAKGRELSETGALTRRPG